MIDQDEIDLQASYWIRDRLEESGGDPGAVCQQWDAFADSHDAETAQALRQSVVFEFFRLIDAFTEWFANGRKAGIPLDEDIELGLRAESPSFTGDRARLRLFLSMIKDRIGEELLEPADHTTESP